MPSGETTSPASTQSRQVSIVNRDAVIAGLTRPWSSGVVEGHVNRIEMLKRPETPMPIFLFGLKHRLNNDGRGTRVEITPVDQSRVDSKHQRDLAGRNISVRGVGTAPSTPGSTRTSKDSMPSATTSSRTSAPTGTSTQRLLHRLGRLADTRHNMRARSHPS